MSASPELSGSGWPIVARKEFADHVRSTRFLVLFGLVALAGLAAVHAATGTIRDAAQQTSGGPSVFLFLFTLSKNRLPSFHEFLGFLGPLLGIAFGFDAINSERSSRTLSRLVAQPVHRDEIVNGKFAAGMGAIGLAVGCVVCLVSGYGIVRLGLVPTAGDVARIVAYVVVLVAYIALWYGVALLASILARRAATAALAALALWLVLTLFGGVISGAIADAVHPVGSAATSADVLANARLDQRIHRISPDELYQEATQVLLDPEARSTDVVTSPSRLDQAIPGELGLRESVSLASWQILVLLGGVAALFAADYLIFMGQEVRA
ncbi:MAG: ABC transporter permease [Ilumatobacteraceae bacterium]